MSPSVLPSQEEALDLVLTPHSVSWRYSSDIRGYLAAGYALLLQVAHPTVGAGVAEHSNFESDPWGRLWRTIDYVTLTVYGGRDAIEVTRRIREMHRTIKGVKPDGSRYHALEPEAFAWVHATLIDAVVRAQRTFGSGMSDREVAGFYAEWLGIGRLLGVRAGDLPEDWAGFRAYFDEMVSTSLEPTPTVAAVLRTLGTPPRPPVLPPRAEPVWRVARAVSSHPLLLCTTGLLPPSLRRRLGVPWSARQELELRALGAVMRGLTPVLPSALRLSGPAYLRHRTRRGMGSEWAPRDRAAAPARTRSGLASPA